MKTRLLPVALLLALSGCGYNRIQELDERVDEAQANIQSELLRRNDLIPNLVATVDEAAAFEQQTYTQVAEARAGVTAARERVANAIREDAAPGGELGAAAAQLTDNLRLFLNVSVEAYPQLRANENFRALQDELTETENRLAFSRREYNETVRGYNTYIRRFPQNLTARIIGAERRAPFEAPVTAQESPQVEFGRRAPGS